MQGNRRFQVGPAGLNRCGAAARVTERVDRVAFLSTSVVTPRVRQHAAKQRRYADVRVRVKVVDRDLTLGAEPLHLGHKAVNTVDRIVRRSPHRRVR